MTRTVQVLKARMSMRRMLLASLAMGFAALAAAPAPAAAAETWPDRPVRVLVPFAPGGVTDTIGRLAADWLSKTLGQPFPVENRSGANGAIAAEAVARSAPDGNTLFTASASQMVMLPALMKINFDPIKDFAPVSIVGSNPMVLAVSTKLGVNNLAEFIALAQREGGKLDYGSAGIGSSTHLAMGLLLSRANIQMVHVPYRGGAPAVQALLAGEVGAYFGNPSDMIPHLDGGRIKVLAVAGPERLASLPGAPTVAEQGFPGFRAVTWNGIAAPACTPEPIIRRMANSLGEACKDAAFRNALERLGTTPVCSTPETFRDAMAADTPLWREAVRVSGASLD
ncbi:Bug family tripartite tricarboxylate transporter substrate binding protein [Roseomonas xinghualingensis]|uniref:Bug family tripartite tricarboxylate transporter substrate binding protein n=1 Tax=Roseomonas xinghualingensis TaxID=2986475 RepID=UPI0021F1D12C|nr:tripartite tricarboxylate transporter substrate binding protein [Roseomonas sp. SXEYE001]MCV4206499.1 tripartite tricarboxylate transporter substrate binding protein [Roseomonas sp. SXEYE001]